ncbi:tetratricopeptide repeat protein [Candidatus Sumerlaeota bacterium]|nr:tetratricopeptide repeat protein [Candidatus Sumerlaeota bacterium]
MSKKNVSSPKSADVKKEQPAPSHEIFTAKRLIIFFAALELLIIALMYPSYRGRRRMNLAKDASRKGEYEKAYEHYQWLGKHTPAPESASYQLELGLVCLHLKRYDESIKHLKLAVEKTEGQAELYSYLGRAYMESGNKAEAKRYFLKELESNPTNPTSNFHLGQIAYAEKKYNEATAYFSRVAYIPQYKNLLKPYWATIEKEVLAK